ncbi:MAG: hypothetical protein K8I29_07595 [Alphaproteobacteria bacterium]|uniref:Type III-B CRISPR module-associated protein Cmr3 n=1 Tax=Candidatus Nitrobium versatile TaxID=2884831 RepID=A0A953JBH7_9BACT|nr:hypothetical protein [Candidatus Nitrobium versatile]
MITTSLFIKPIDVLFLRGNRLFGGPGTHGDILMPPWPSVITGAVCSRMLADNNLLGKATAMGNDAPALINELTGRLMPIYVSLADEKKNELYFPAPADIVFEKQNNNETLPDVHIVKPITTSVLAGCTSSSPIPAPGGIRSASPIKPDSGWWLTTEGLMRHLSGEKIKANHLRKAKSLWISDLRLGIALNRGSRTADEGRIYTSDAVVLSDNIGFVAAFRHEKGALPSEGLVRLGGDGRGAELFPFDSTPVELGKPQKGWKKFRMIFSTPCPSPGGWLPPGVIGTEDGSYMLDVADCRAKLYSAALTRYEVISGWDLACHAPKTALKMIPSGSVYWFEIQHGDSDALENIWNDGLLAETTDEEYAGRWREGFGRVWFGKA